MLLIILLIIVTVFLVAYFIYNIGFKTTSLQLPPIVSPNYPILGNAIVYKASPQVFMLNAAQKYGEVFLINLAGLHTTIVTSPKLTKQFALSSESVLSAREAVSDFGFLYALGELNVMHGTDFHKFIVKNHFYQETQLLQKSKEYYFIIKECIQTELQRLSGVGISPRSSTTAQQPSRIYKINDLFYFIRRIILKVNIIDFLGVYAYNKYNELGIPKLFIYTQSVFTLCYVP